MYQAIQTRFLGPTSFKGSRIKATASAGSVTLNWDHRLNPNGNHKAAAEALARKFGWTGTWHGGELPNQDYAFVLETDETVKITPLDIAA